MGDFQINDNTMSQDCPKNHITRTIKFLWFKKTVHELGKHQLYVSGVGLCLHYNVEVTCEICHCRWKLWWMKEEAMLFKFFTDIPYIKCTWLDFSLDYDDFKKLLKPEYRKKEDR